MRVFVPNHYSFKKNKKNQNSSSSPTNQDPSQSSPPVTSSEKVDAEEATSILSLSHHGSKKQESKEFPTASSSCIDPKKEEKNTKYKVNHPSCSLPQRGHLHPNQEDNIPVRSFSICETDPVTCTRTSPVLKKETPLLASRSHSSSTPHTDISAIPAHRFRDIRQESNTSSAIPSFSISHCNDPSANNIKTKRNTNTKTYTNTGALRSSKRQKVDLQRKHNQIQGSQKQVQKLELESESSIINNSLDYKEDSSPKTQLSTSRIRKAAGTKMGTGRQSETDDPASRSHLHLHQQDDTYQYRNPCDNTSKQQRKLSATRNKSIELSNAENFGKLLKKRGLEEVEQEGDGNCLFRAVSLQIYGDPDSHLDVRKRCMDFMAKDESHFSQFVVDEPFQEYITRKRSDGVHGNNPEIQAISELYNRPVEVFVPENGASPINIFQSEYKTGDAPIRLSYHDGNHYNAVIDPLFPTAGLGLGLPGLEPGLADKLQMQKAVDESDQFYIQKITNDADDLELKRAVQESKLAAKTVDFDFMYEKKKALAFSDIEETNYEMEQAMLLSSLETFQNAEGSRKQSGEQIVSGHDHDCGRIRNPSQHCDNVRSHSSRIQASRSFLSSESSADVAPLSSVASSSSAAIGNQHEDRVPAHLLRHEQDEYPQTVQELVMNGFELPKVLRAYDLIGDNFEDLLSFLMNSGN